MRFPSGKRAVWFVLVLLGVLGLSVLYTARWAGRDIVGDGGVWLNVGGWWEGVGGESKMEGGGGEDQEDGDLLDTVHPITHLMRVAEKQFAVLLGKASGTLQDAAETYREKRGRHPPPGFDAWYAYAVAHNATVVEEFWDQIYDDLAPFWSTEPVLLRKVAHVFSPKIAIREGRVEVKTHNAYKKLDLWAAMLDALAKHPQVNLPDMDIPFNVNAEPAMLVPWELIDSAVSLARPILLEPAEVVSAYSGLDDIDELTAKFTFDPEWLGPRLTHPASHLGPRPFWSLVRPACPPESAARTGHVFDDIWDPEGETSKEHAATALLPLSLPKQSLKGYTKNWTSTIDACEWPNGQGLHSAFVAPKEMSVSQKLFPLFGDLKLSMSNEILVPGAAEWSISAEDSHKDWGKRNEKLFWRGPATQGRDPARYWRRFQRERFVSMLNATHVEIADASTHTGNESTVGVGYAKNSRILPGNDYNLQSQTSGQLAGWANSWSDAAFTDLGCETKADEGCSYFDEYFSVASLSGKDEQDQAKYTAVIDGEGGDDNGNLIHALHNGKITLRASVYRKWYDNRLVPWLHFAPMDNTFVDLYGIMEYFLGSKVSEEAKTFLHAVGEVQKHEHHFNTPGSINMEETSEHASGEQHPTQAPSDNDSTNHHKAGDALRRSSRLRQREADGHDAQAQAIAEASATWAAKVLRREDALIYVYRVLLEYARLVEDHRERLGWVDDLVAK